MLKPITTVSESLIRAILKTQWEAEDRQADHPEGWAQRHHKSRALAIVTALDEFDDLMTAIREQKRGRGKK